jgi:hypothetical protein
MVEATILALVDGVRIVVPNSIELITPYVLHEQQDFFEDELPFVRGLLQAGQKVIDIGANYGVYTLERLEDIHELGFGSPEMERRLDLVRRRIDHARQQALR